MHADVYGAIASRLTGVPFVSTRHNDDRYQLGPFRYVDRAFASGASRLIAISDAVRRFLVRAGLPDRKFETIRYGLDEMPSLPSEIAPAQAGVPDGAPLVLAIGRLIEQKDHATLLRAFARVHERLPDARLAILGDGPLLAPNSGARGRARADRRRRRSPGGSRRATGSTGPTSSRTVRDGRDSGSSCSRRCSPGYLSSLRG